MKSVFEWTWRAKQKWPESWQQAKHTQGYILTYSQLERGNHGYLRNLGTGDPFLLVFCIYPMLHPSQGYKTHTNDKDPPSTMPHGYWRPLSRLPPISITLLLPTTANGTRSWWRQSTNQNGQIEISQLVDVLSPVTYTGLYQGCQTETDLEIIRKQLFLSFFSFLLLSFMSSNVGLPH